MSWINRALEYDETPLQNDEQEVLGSSWAKVQQFVVSS